MTDQAESIKRKLSLLQLAEELGNVAKAARIMEFHRDSFYEVRKAFQSGGVAALIEQRRGARSAASRRPLDCGLAGKPPVAIQVQVDCSRPYQ